MTLTESLNKMQNALDNFNPDNTTEFYEVFTEFRAMCIVDIAGEPARRHLQRATELFETGTTTMDECLALREVAEAITALSPTRARTRERRIRSDAELRALGVSETQIAAIRRSEDGAAQNSGNIDTAEIVALVNYDADVPEEIREDILQGVPIRAVAVNHNITVDEVKNYAALLGVEAVKAPGQISPADKAKVIELYEQDTTLDYKAIAQKLSRAEHVCPESQVRDVLLAYVRAKESGKITSKKRKETSRGKKEDSCE